MSTPLLRCVCVVATLVAITNSIVSGGEYRLSSPVEFGTEINRWQRLSLSRFSAGYGAVREILNLPDAFDRVQCIVAADSIDAGLDAAADARAVDPEHMQHFRSLAREAAAGRRRFIISHSQLETPYASTVETADDLLQAADVSRQADSTLKLGQFRLRTGRICCCGATEERISEAVPAPRHGPCAASRIYSIGGSSTETGLERLLVF